MRQRVAMFVFAAGLAGFTTLRAQAAPETGFAVTKCEEPKVPIGALGKSTGIVSFQLSRDGKPDTTSLAVLKVLGLSVAGFKSVAARQLSACRFSVPKSVNAATLVIATVNTDAANVGIGTATVPDAVSVPLAVEPFTLARDTMPFAEDDARVEERPRRYNCSVGGGKITTIRGTGSTAAEARADAQRQMQDAQARDAVTHEGRLTAILRVSAEGKPGSALRVISSTNPGATQYLGDLIGSCKYVPARILGVAVPFLFRTSVGMTSQ